MRNIFLFIRRHFVLLCFVFLQGIAWWMYFKYNRYHRSVFLGVASEITGSINTQVDKVDDYFHLREENRRVHRMNDSLLKLLTINYNTPDTSQRLVVDSLKVDSLTQVMRYTYRDAKVVYNSINFENNYLQINRGANHGIKDNMAVINSDGAIVGQVVNTSPNFSQVMSLLHTQSSVHAMLKNTNQAGIITWNTIDPRYLDLSNISTDIEVKKGDTVLSSRYSFNYPPGFMVGVVDSIKIDKATNFYIIRLKAAVNFGSIQQVFVVENLQREEQIQLDEATKEKVQKNIQ